MRSILVTGFGPFDRFIDNPSELLARALEREFDDVQARTLPVVYGEGRRTILSCLDELEPDLTICFGLNARIGHIGLEEVAVNLMSSEIPDNSGKLLIDRPISEEGPLAYRSRLPLRDIMTGLRERGIPARLSYSAGVYICNEVFYTLMEWCESNGKVGGFIHIPMETEMMASNTKMYGMPHMSRKMLLDAGRMIVDISRNTIR